MNQLRHPNLFIVGAPRCGTTSLYHYLRVHPDVFMSPVKELHFFGNDIRPPAANIVKDQDRYLRMFSAARHERWVGEASPFYLSSKSAAEEIRAASPAARIIIMLRNPAQLLYAMYQAGLYPRLFGSDPDPREAEDARRIVRFPEQLARWWAAFGREQVHVILFDDLVADARSMFLGVCAFLDIAAIVPRRLPVHAPTRIPRWASAHRAVRDPASRLRRFARVVPYTVRRHLGTIADRVVSRRPPPMDPELRARLLREFRDDVERLGQLLERDLRAWLPPTAPSP